ncbi:DUF6402 family protein [Pseudomonas japonica]|uniref:DUF6402 family protein n=1 Tax=Pseudomonas japonica TaxID=256466 RepID=UPI00380A06D3
MSLKDFQQTTALGPDALFLLEGATLDTSPGGQHRPKQIMINALPLTKLPVAMRRMGWHTSAALMQRWFDSPGWQMPEDWKQVRTQPAPLSLPRAQCDDVIVKMSWATGFDRCRQAINLAESRVTTPRAISRLVELLEKAGWPKTGVFILGDTSLSAREMDALPQINIADLGSTFDPLDDMYGALGMATVKVGVVGRTFSQIDIVTKKKKNFFHIQHLGFYIRDHYDFNGMQFLGIWNDNRVLNQQEIPALITSDESKIFKIDEGPIALITNGDFRAYRDKTGMGGDYIIYSDILWKQVDQVVALDREN